jgi:hypothetical protein
LAVYLTKEKIEELITIAAANDGHCDRCLRVIQVYKYQVSKTMAKIMREMAKATRETGERAIDMETLDLTHTERSQLSKMRQHGIVVQPKDERGVKRPRHWLITTKGWQFLRGEEIPAKVIVFDNQVLGHEGGTTNIRRLLDDPGFYETDPLSTPEAAALHDVRTPKRKISYKAIWLNKHSSVLSMGTIYDIEIERLQMGKAVELTVTDDTGVEREYTYNDIAMFAKYWKITEG